jgi:hypothetical protein
MYFVVAVVVVIVNLFTSIAKLDIACQNLNR